MRVSSASMSNAECPNRVTFTGPLCPTAGLRHLVAVDANSSTSGVRRRVGGDLLLFSGP
jgi:hypothetical protein